MGQNMSCTDDSSVCGASTRYIQKNQGHRAESGVGINFNVINDGSRQLQVHSVLPDGAAARAGTVLPGDVLLAVDGKNVYSILDQAEICRLVRGHAGSTVELSFRRGAQVVKVNLIRSTVPPSFRVGHSSLEDDESSLGTRLGTVTVPMTSPRGLPDQAFTLSPRVSTVDERVRLSSPSRQETWSPKQPVADRSPNGNSIVGKRPLPPPMKAPGKGNEQGATVQSAGKGEIKDSQKGRGGGNDDSASGVASVHTEDRTSPFVLETAGYMFANNPIDAFGKGLEVGKGTKASTSSQDEDIFARNIEQNCGQEIRGDMQNTSATIAISTATLSQGALGLVSNSSNLRVDTANYSPMTYQMSSMGSPPRQAIAGLPSPGSLSVSSQRAPPVKPISIHNSSLTPPVSSQRSPPVKPSSIPISPSLSSGGGRSQSAASRTLSDTASRTSSTSGAEISPLLRPSSPITEPITELQKMQGSASGGTSQKAPPSVAASQPAAQKQCRTNGPVGVAISGRQIVHPSAVLPYGVVPAFQPEGNDKVLTKHFVSVSYLR